MRTLDNILFCLLTLLVILICHHLTKLEKQVSDLQERIELLEKRQ